MAGIKQESKGDARASIPVLGMLPILGRFFTAPKQTSDLRDIIITVTPHIIRSAALDQEDHLAHHGGTQMSGLAPSIEDVVQRAQLEEERDRRLSASAQPVPPSALPNATARITETSQPLLSPSPPQAKTPRP